MENFFNKKISINVVALALSIFTLLAYHFPFFKVVTDNVKGGFNSVVIVGGLVVIMIALNYMVYNLLLYLGRNIGRFIIAFLLVANSITFYFINTYDVLITDAMMGNVFNTRYSEASAFFSLYSVLYVLFLGILPIILLFKVKIDYKTGKKCLSHTGISLGVTLLLVLANIHNFTWVDRNATQIGSLLMPWSYIINSVRYYNKVKKLNQKEILLPDAKIATDGKDVCVLIIGESARRENFSLYGYSKHTNPLLEKDSVTAYIANAAATYTTAGVKAILDHKATGKLYEILPNYLFRNGVDVRWRSTNWGEPPVHIDHYLNLDSLKRRYPAANSQYDAILLEGLSDEIKNSEKEKMFIVLHTSTSHGPTYYKKYPAEFEKFTPVCTTVEMGEADLGELMNAYDNTILYTDYLVHSVIEILKNIPERRSSVIFVSDHGESLGENNLYMHGVPISMAPKEQVEIPFIVWTSSPDDKLKPLGQVGQYHVFHSVLNFLGLESSVYDEQMNIFQ